MVSVYVVTRSEAALFCCKGTVYLEFLVRFCPTTIGVALAVIAFQCSV